jgi:hypothetical protein
MKNKIIMIFLIMVGILVTGDAQLSFSADINALLNAGFEEGEAYWYNWNDGASSGRISAEYSRSGRKSACREISGEGEGCFGQRIPVFSGDIIEASVWVMNPVREALEESGEVFLRIEFWDAAEDHLYQYDVESRRISGPTNKWVKLETTGVAPNSVAEARILAFNKGDRNSSKGKAYFDDFEVIISK